jgi:hypothetical protein
MLAKIKSQQMHGEAEDEVGVLLRSRSIVAFNEAEGHELTE